MENSKKHWYNDGELFRQGFIQSNYITAITDWFMGLAGKATVLVLYFTVLYSCIQLYPKVTLPDGLSLAVFIVQMGALDIGGLSLGTLARQAHKVGSEQEAKQASRLSKALIIIMLLSVVTVSIGHVVTIEPHVFAAIQIIQVIARSICAVLYGRVVHDLKQEKNLTTFTVAIPDFLETLKLSEEKTEQRITALAESFRNSLQEMSQKVQQSVVLNDKNISENEQRIAYFLRHELQPISEQLLSLKPSQDLEQTLQDSDSELDEEPQDSDKIEIASEVDEAKPSGRKYYLTFEEASEQFGFTIQQLKRRANAGEIEVNSSGKIRTKSLQNFLKKSSTKSKETVKLPALKLVKKA